MIATVPDGIVALIITPAENANDPKRRFCAGLMPAEFNLINTTVSSWPTALDWFGALSIGSERLAN